MNYETTAQQILEHLGIANIKTVTHCMTRLRFLLKTDAHINDDIVKKIPGVMGVMRKGGQYQIIIGNDVGKCYQHIQALGGFSSAVETEQPKTKKSGRDILNGIFDYISGSMQGLIPALIGGGMIKVVLIVLPMLQLLNKDSSTYAILSFFGDAPFYFMPVMLAYTASQKMQVTPMLAVTVAGIMLHPNFSAMIASGDPMTLFGLPITAVTYSSTVIPILIMVWLMKYLERLVQRVVPSILKSFLTPLLVILVSGTLALVVVGPLGSFAGNGLYAMISWIQQYAGWLAMAIVVAFMPMIVMTGMHWALAVFALVASQQNPDTYPASSRYAGRKSCTGGCLYGCWSACQKQGFENDSLLLWDSGTSGRRYRAGDVRCYVEIEKTDDCHDDFRWNMRSVCRSVFVEILHLCSTVFVITPSVCFGNRQF